MGNLSEVERVGSFVAGYCYENFNFIFLKIYVITNISYEKKESTESKQGR